MTLSELLTNIDYRRRDTTQSFISDNEKTAYLNEALRKIGGENDWEWQKTSSSVSYTDGSYQYAVSSVASDIKFPIDVFYTNSYEFENVSPEDFQRLSGGSHNMYALDGNYLWVSTDFGTATLGLSYYSTSLAKTSGSYTLSRLSTSTDEPLLPERYQDMLVEYASALCYQKEGMLDDYQIAMQGYMRSLERMKRDYPSRRKTRKTRMKSINEMDTLQDVYDDKQNPLHQ